MKIVDTERLSLSLIILDDAAFYLELINDPSWIANISDKGIRSMEAARESILSGPVASQLANGFSLYVVKRQTDNVAMGLCGLIKRDSLKNVDIGYAFLPAYVGQGYALEAAKAVVGYANAVLGLTKLAAITSPNNQRSHQLLHKLGFILEETLVLPGEERMTNLYGLTFNS